MEKQENKLSFKELLSILQKCSSVNMGKGVFVLILFTVIQTVISFISLVPSFGSAMGGTGIAFSSAILSLGFFFAGSIVISIILYGVFVIFARMIEVKRVTVGYMFIGFKQDKRVFISAVIFTVLLLIAAFAATFTGFGLNLFSLSAVDPSQPQKAVTAVLPMFLIYIAFIIVFLLPFIFVFFFLYVDPNLKVMKAFALSAKLFYKNIFRFIGFVFAAGNYWLLAYAVSTFITIIIPSDANTALLSISSLLSIVGVITQYVTMVRIYMSVPLFFFERIGAIQMTKPEEEKLDLLEEMADDLK